ncbi:MAG: DinB family protein [Acidimicrobiales bacterium]
MSQLSGAQNPSDRSMSSTDAERADLLETLAEHRSFLRFTVQGLTDEQAAQRTTVSELCLGGLLKHVCDVEGRWVGFIEQGATAMRGSDEAAMEARARSFRMLEGERLEDLLEHYQDTADRTDELVRTLPSLDVSHPLPDAPWFPPDTRWTARRVLLHIIAETSQHAGHADILREAIDGQKTMG